MSECTSTPATVQLRQKICSAIDLLEQPHDYKHPAKVLLVEALALLSQSLSSTEERGEPGFFEHWLNVLAQECFGDERPENWVAKLAVRVRELNRAPSSMKCSEALVTVREDIVRFLLGEGALDGKWYGDRDPGQPAYWWRGPLRLSMHPYSLPSAIERPSWHDVLLLRWCEWTGGHLSDKDFLKEVHDIVTDNLLQTTEQRPTSTKARGA